MSKVFTIGEALIDFIPNEKGISLKDVSSFLKVSGGAPANVACAVAKLGGQSAFIGKLGMDAFGDFLLDTFKETGVDTSCIVRTDEARTALAFVSLRKDGNRDFLFFRNPSADMLLDKKEISREWFAEGDILHFCSVDLIEAPVKYAHIQAINYIKENHGIISFDPNVRLPLWGNETECRNTILEFIPLANILKISSEELEFITQIADKEEAIKSLFAGNVELILYTKGPEGAELHIKNFSTSVSATKVDVLDTTGAGDAFIGAFLFQLCKDDCNISNLTYEKAGNLLKFAETAASLSTAKKGAISSLPELCEVNLYFRHYLG